MSTPPKRNGALASDDEENTPAKRIRFAIPPTKVGASSSDGGGVTLAVGNVQPISFSTLDEVLETMPHRDWIAIEMGVSDDARER